MEARERERLTADWRGRPKPGSKRRGVYPDREKDREVIRKINSGKSVSEVAEELGVTRQAIRVRLRRIELEQQREETMATG